MEVEIKYYTVGKWCENSYLIKAGNDAWLVDPGDEFEQLENVFKVEELSLKGIINTHGHFDHVGAVSQFKEKYKLPFYIHSKDKQILSQANLYKKLAGGITFFITPTIDEYLDDQKNIIINQKNIKVHHTPGHTNGSVSFEIDKTLITGDLLFKANIGRVDLPGGNIELLNQSILFVLENFEGFMIYPGHGEPFLLDEQVISTLKKMI